MAPSRTRQMVANGFSVSKIRRTTYHQIPNQSNYIRMKWNWFSCNAKKHGTQAASINKLLDSRKSWNHGVKRFSLFWAKSPTALLWEFLPHGSAFIIPLNNWNERWTNDLVIFGEEQRQRQHTDRVGHTAPGLRYPRGEEGSSVWSKKQQQQQQLALAMFAVILLQAKQTVCVIRSHYISEKFLILSK